MNIIEIIIQTAQKVFSTKNIQSQKKKWNYYFVTQTLAIYFTKDG